MRGKTLILLLGDQLSPQMSALRDISPGAAVILMCEVMEEATYVPHHKKKIAFLFAAMRHFAAALAEAGWHVDYVALEAPGNSGSFSGEVARACARHDIAQVRVTEPGEWRVRRAMETWPDALGVPVTILEDDRFFCSHARFARWAGNRSQLRMEYFYRDMRRESGLLMDGDAPAGGQWNYDADNRKPVPASLEPPDRLRHAPDAITQDVLALVEVRFCEHFGDLEPFWFAVTHAQAEDTFQHFIDTALARYGDYQDAMRSGEPFLWHSVIALYLNCGLLDARDVCARIEAAWRAGRVPINAAEGFIRQILGWREYVRGIYWHEGPDYAARNALGATRPLPDFYWTGETDMACLADAIAQTRRHAYAHHIQRLMVTGTFALLAGIEPQVVHQWYLLVYADAYEWVELPNTLGMSQFADGGLLASKPYAASGNYINRMSDYCGTCRFDVKAKTGPTACPFNYLYWDFLARNRAHLAGNRRLAYPYATLARFTAEQRAAIAASARQFLATLAAE